MAQRASGTAVKKKPATPKQDATILAPKAVTAAHRTAMVATLKDATCKALIAIDGAKGKFDNVRDTSDASVLANLKDIRARCGSDSSTFTGIVSDLYGNGLRGNKHTDGEVLDAIKSQVNVANVRTYLTKYRKVADAMIDPTYKTTRVVKAADGTETIEEDILRNLYDALTPSGIAKKAKAEAEAKAKAGEVSAPDAPKGAQESQTTPVSPKAMKRQARLLWKMGPASVGLFLSSLAEVMRKAMPDAAAELTDVCDTIADNDDDADETATA